MTVKYKYVLRQVNNHSVMILAIIIEKLDKSEVQRCVTLQV